MSQFKVGDIVEYAPLDLNAPNYSERYIGHVGIVTDKPRNKQQPPERNETLVHWISGFPGMDPNPCKHYSYNLRKIGELGAPDGPPDAV